MIDGLSIVHITWNFVRSGALTVATIADADLPAFEALMREYRDRPIDYVDATLVHLAQRESIATVFTIDHDDFETYRWVGANGSASCRRDDCRAVCAQITKGRTIPQSSRPNPQIINHPTVAQSVD